MQSSRSTSKRTQKHIGDIAKQGQHVANIIQKTKKMKLLACYTHRKGVYDHDLVKSGKTVVYAFTNY